MASMNIERASSSSSSTHQLTYEVFLSFRGEDTRYGFTSHLYTALDERGICTFIDDKTLDRGKSISPTLLKAIEESRFAIVILSKNYASSTWCLEELEEIIGCITKTRITVLPIFYHVDPSDVRNQTGDFKQAFDKHEERFKENIEKVQKWRAALKEVANTSGWHIPTRSEVEVIQDIVKVTFNKSIHTFLVDTKGLVGINSRVEKLKSYLAIESNDVRIIGIWGTGGMGKTTLARVVYDMVFNQFEACCFIADVRENFEKKGLLWLQKELLKKLLVYKDIDVQDINSGVLMLKNRLRRKKILLVLDDVNELEQLNKLMGVHDWFGPGSRVIITTRDMHLLARKVDGIYEVAGLNYDEAFHLFTLKAFEKGHPPKEYQELCKAFVHYANGLPLAIEVLGSLLINRSINEWESELNKLEKIPERKILDVLEISFNGLKETEQKIFMNIACFLNHENRETIIEILDYLELFPEIGLSVLVDKSLIKLHWKHVWMHDLLQQMGRDIVRREYADDPGKRSRLWSYRDIDNVLTKNTGTNAIQCIVLKLMEPKVANWNPKSFSKMHNLKLLIIDNVHLMHDLEHLPNDLRFLDWSGYSSKSLPSSFQSNELIDLRMCCSNIERLWTGTKSFDRLKFIKVNKSQKLIETPDFTKIPVLEKLDLEDCINLRGVHPSIGVHIKLTLLNLKGCKNLTSLPDKFEMKSLEILILSGCSKVRKIPEFGENMKYVLKLCLDGTAIIELPTSIGVLKKLTLLNLKACKSLKTLPSKFEMEALEILTLSDCSKVKKIPDFGEDMKSVLKLYLDGTAITKLPTSIEHLIGLSSLKLRDCKNLVCLPSTLFNLKLLKDVDIAGCSKLESLPENLGNAESIEKFDVSGTAIRQVPSSLGLLKNLKGLYFCGCKGFSSSYKSWYDLLPLCSMPRSPDHVGLSFLSLSGLRSLTELNLRNCNLMTMPDDIGCLFSLDVLNLSGNNFGFLPESIAQLSSLRYLNLDNCTSLQSLPKLPLNVDYIRGFGCTSLETVPNLLKPNSSIEPTLNLSDCSKLANNQGFIDMFLAVIKKFLQGLSLNDRYLHKRYSIIIPGSEVPKWFRHQSIGAEVNIKEHSSHLCNEWMGIAACVVFCSHPHHQIHDNCSLSCWLIVNGKQMSAAPNTGQIVVLSDHIWLVYLLPQYYQDKQIKSLWECDANGYIRIGIKIATHGSIFRVKKCGFRMVYKKDIEDINQTMAQSSNDSIIPYDLYVPRHNLDNAAMVAEGNKVKQRRDDYDGAGPSGEGSSNNVPLLKRIVRSQVSIRNVMSS